jgi:hypothetical protein
LQEDEDDEDEDDSGRCQRMKERRDERDDRLQSARVRLPDFHRYGPLRGLRWGALAAGLGA